MRSESASTAYAIPEIIMHAPDRKIESSEPLARAHFDARLRSYPSEVGGGHWLPIGQGRPYIPHDMPEAAALSRSVWASYVPATRERYVGTSLGTDGERAAAEDDSYDDATSEAPRKKRKNRGRRKPVTERGAVVWDGDATARPPIPLIVLSLIHI